MKIVAEIGLAHEGSLGMALAYIDACAKAGVDAVKFQHHYGDPVNEFRNGTYFPQDDSRNEYWRRTDFLIDQWREIKNLCKSRGVQFGLSVFSELAVRTLNDCNFAPDFWKLGSGVSTNREMHAALRHSNQHNAVLSFGLSTTKEIKSAFENCAYGNSETAGLSLTLLQCTSEYPCSPERVGLRYLKKLFGIGFEASDVGLSDHSGTIWPGICAAWMGADMLEVHVTWSKECFGPDVSSSLKIDELRQLVQGVRFVEKMRANPVDKDAMAEKLKPMREIFCVPH